MGIRAVFSAFLRAAYYGDFVRLLTDFAASRTWGKVSESRTGTRVKEIEFDRDPPQRAPPRGLGSARR